MPSLPQLRSLTVRDTHIAETSDDEYLINFLRHLSSNTPLEELYLIIDSYEGDDHSIPIDGLVEHLITKHSNTLRILHIPAGSLSLEMARNLCIKCPRMEELAIACYDYVSHHQVLCSRSLC